MTRVRGEALCLREGVAETMNHNLSCITIALLTFGLASPAFAAEDDVIACEGKAEGEACEEADGEQGTCQPDGVDGVLECEERSRKSRERLS